eukprot:COSAG02_NODE_2535_length_8585_cov_3.664624_2_plen_81_part_00
MVSTCLRGEHLCNDIHIRGFSAVQIRAFIATRKHGGIATRDVIACRRLRQPEDTEGNECNGNKATETYVVISEVWLLYEV